MSRIFKSGYDTLTFSEVFPNVNDFKTSFNESPYKGKLKDESLEIIYYLLASRYMNSHFSNSSIKQSRWRLNSYLFMYGPSWERRLAVQERLRQLNEKEIMQGATVLYNYASNPSTSGNTLQDIPLDVLNAQNATKYSKSVLEAYQLLSDLIVTDVTKPFLAKFQDLFIKVLPPSRTPTYITYLEDDDNE